MLADVSIGTTGDATPVVKLTAETQLERDTLARLLELAPRDSARLAVVFALNTSGSGRPGSGHEPGIDVLFIGPITDTAVVA